jgi:hypothetical protein
MADKVTFDPLNKIIGVVVGVRVLDVQYDVYSAWKRWWYSDVDNTKYLPALRTVGGDELGGGKSLGATFFLINGWKLRPPEEDCTLQVIGNLYDDGGGSVFVKTVGNYNAMVVMQVSNLTDSQVVESELSKNLDYNGFVYYSESSTWTGTEYPVGTVNRPVNNLTDAILLCEKVGTKSIRIYGNMAIDRNMSAYNITGMDSSSCVFFSNCDVSLCTFSKIGLYGDMTGRIRADECVLENVRGVCGEFNTCAFKGHILLSNDDSCLVNCFTKFGMNDYVVFDSNHSEIISFCLRAYSGSIVFDNFSDPNTFVECDFLSGKVAITSTCTGSRFVFRGDVTVQNNSTLSIDVVGIINNGSIRDAIFSTGMSQFIDGESFGGFIKNKLLTVSKFVGLS